MAFKVERYSDPYSPKVVRRKPFVEVLPLYRNSSPQHGRAKYSWVPVLSKEHCSSRSESISPVGNRSRKKRPRSPLEKDTCRNKCTSLPLTILHSPQTSHKVPLDRPTSPSLLSTSQQIRRFLYSKKTQKFIRILSGLCPLFQLILMITVFALLLQSHYQANFAQNQLLRYKEQESALLLQLHRIEQHSMKVHDNILTRLEHAGISTFGLKDGNVSGDKHNPLMKQQAQLQAMSKELHGQVEPLQEIIQQEASETIIRTFGEGPIKLVFDLQISPSPTTGENEERKEVDQLQNTVFELPTVPSSTRRRTSYANNKENQFEILLWPDTPHAAWALLEQVKRHQWDGAKIRWTPSHRALELIPSHDDPLERGKLHFSEHFEIEEGVLHSAWTVGVREDPETERLQLFVNLHNNKDTHGHETCVGKVIDGFDTLQGILKTSRLPSGALREATIREVHALHLSKRELEMM